MSTYFSRWVPVPRKGAEVQSHRYQGSCLAHIIPSAPFKRRYTIAQSQRQSRTIPQGGEQTNPSHHSAYWGYQTQSEDRRRNRNTTPCIEHEFCLLRNISLRSLEKIEQEICGTVDGFLLGDDHRALNSPMGHVRRTHW